MFMVENGFFGKFLSTPSVWRATSVRHVVVNIQSERFLSTPSVWRATHADLFQKVVMSISIHALRVEGDGV